MGTQGTNYYSVPEPARSAPATSALGRALYAHLSYELSLFPAIDFFHFLAAFFLFLG